MTQELVQDLFNYDPDTGILTNKIARWGAKAGGIAGGIAGAGYLLVSIKRINHTVHRICFLHYHGYLPAMLDHKDNNKLNNRILNLRECTKQENSFNAKISKANKSGIKGVSWNKKAKKWMAGMKINGKNNYLGLFTEIEDARKAVEDARGRLHKEFCNHG
jgi:hypothetical protein